MMAAQMSSQGTGARDKRTLSSPRVISFSSNIWRVSQINTLNSESHFTEENVVCKTLVML